MTYKPLTFNISKTMQKHWHLLQINDKIGKLFTNPPGTFGKVRKSQRANWWKHNN